MILSDARKIDQIVDKNSIDLTIVKPPYYNPREEPNHHIQLIKTVMQKITKVTKIGGICCLITSDDKIEDRLDTTEMMALYEIGQDPEIGTKWITVGKILWVKSPKNAVESLSPMNEGTLVSFELTPFSTIWIMVRNDNKDDYEELDIVENVENLHIAEEKKDEMLDSMWFIPQTSERGYKDHLPKELILRLLMVFSKEDNVVLDPFSGQGITAIASLILKRHFICINKNKECVTISKNRIKNFEQN